MGSGSTPGASMEGEVWLEAAEADGRPRIAVAGRLDLVAGSKLSALCDVILARSPVGLALDLTGVADATSGGAAAVARCLSAGRRLAGGIDVAVASSAGRRVLLDALVKS